MCWRCSKQGAGCEVQRGEAGRGGRERAGQLRLEEDGTRVSSRELPGAEGFQSRNLYVRHAVSLLSMQARERLARIRVRGPARPRWTYAQDLGQRTVGFKLSIHVARSAASTTRDLDPPSRLANHARTRLQQFNCSPFRRTLLPVHRTAGRQTLTQA